MKGNGRTTREKVCDSSLRNYSNFFFAVISIFFSPIFKMLYIVIFVTISIIIYYFVLLNVCCIIVYRSWNFEAYRRNSLRGVISQ